MASTETILKCTAATQAIEAGAGSFELHFPPTSRSWSIIADLACGDPVTVESADGDTFTGRVEDTDEDYCTVTVKLD